MDAGFYYYITSRGKVEEMCQKKVGEGVHMEKLPPANQNHSFQSDLHFSHKKKMEVAIMTTTPQTLL